MNVICVSLLMLRGLRCDTLKNDGRCNSVEKNGVNYVIFVFFAQKSILVASQNWSWATDVTWTVLPMYLLRFWTWEHFSCVAVYGGFDSSRISSKSILICVTEDEWRSYGFGMTWGWVINDRILILVWTNTLTVFLPTANVWMVVYF